MKRLFVSLVVAVAFATAGVAAAVADPPTPSPGADNAAPLPQSMVTIDSFSSKPAVVDGLQGYTFSFSAHWTRVQSSNLYILCVDDEELGFTCWSFPNTTNGQATGVGQPTLSFSATDVPDGFAFTIFGAIPIRFLPFYVIACAPTRGCSKGPAVTEVIPAT